MKQIIRAGGYAVSTINARPWINMPVEPKREKSGRICKQATIIHPIFKECAALTEDPMWQSVFNQASIGKFPKGFTFKDGRLASKGKSKIRTITIGDDPLEVLYLCIEFFKLTAGLTSERDQARNKKEYDTAYSKDPDTFVSSLRTRKGYREECIRNYLEDLANRHNLDQGSFYHLISLVEIGFFLNKLDYKKDLILDDDKMIVTAINGLTFDNDEKRFYIADDHPLKLAPRTIKKKVTREGIIDQRWRKFLEDLDKKKKKVSFQNSILASPSVSKRTNLSVGSNHSP
jgi:hypothetical protein